MIRQLPIGEVDNLLPLLYDMWKEQSATRQAFDAEYLHNGLSYLSCNSDDFIILTDEGIDCCLIGHVSPSMFFPDREGFEDLLYIRKDKRGTSRFHRLLKEFENFCLARRAIKIRVGVGTGIMDDAVAAMYQREGYALSYRGFVKEISACVVVVDVEASLER